jgi:hypothetical protein
MSWGKYLRAAFGNRWNLLALFGSIGFSLLSGHADVALPLVAAAEISFLGFVATHPKFRMYTDMQTSGAAKRQVSQSVESALNHIRDSLPRPAIARFEALRAHCQDLRQIALDLKQSGGADSAPLDSMQRAGLDRLLWIFLRLLFTQFSLSRFLEQTKRDQINADLRQVEQRLATLPKETDAGAAAHTDKVRRSLEDHRQTCRERLDNFEKARANFELVGLELDRLENKIVSLAEMAVNRQEPDFISSQVDQVASSMRETERTMNELDFATGIGPLEDVSPELLPQRIEQTH